MNYLLLLLIPVGFGLNPVISRALHETFQPATLAVLRWAPSAMLIGLVALLRGRREKWSAPPSDMFVMVWLGMAGMGFCAYAAYAATQTTTATTTGLMYACTAALVAIWEIARGQTRASPLLVLGLICCIAGVATLLTRGHLETLLSLAFGRGELWAMAGTLVWTIYSVAMRPRATMLTPFASFTVLSGSAALATAPVMMLELSEFGWPVLQPIHAAWLTALALITGVAAFMAYNLSLIRNGAILTAAILCLSPLYIAGLAIVLIGEEVAWFHGLALALVTSGLIALNLARLKA